MQYAADAAEARLYIATKSRKIVSVLLSNE
jgi:hypothetical protein